MTPCQWIIGSRRFRKTLSSSTRTEKSKIRDVSLRYFEISASKTLKDETNTSSRKFGKQSPSDGVSHPTRPETSTTPPRKPRNSRPAASYELYPTIKYSEYMWTEDEVFFISNFRRVMNVVCFLLGNSPASEIYMPTFRNTLFHLHRQVDVCTHTYLSMKMEQSVPKCRVIYFRRRGIIQKKAYNKM